MSLYPFVILLGGQATRLRPITEKIPKALVEVGGRPFIEHQLKLIKSRGAQDVLILAWYKGEMIRDFAGHGADFGLNIQYVFDGDQPLGTAGAIRSALNILKHPFFVLYGDSYLPCNYSDIQLHFDQQQRSGLMAIYRNEGKWDTSNVELRDGRIVCYDKKNRNLRMCFIDYGLGLFYPQVFSSLTKGQPADLAKVYQRLISEENLSAYVVEQRFYEVGSFSGLRELDELLTKDPDHFLREETQ